MRNYRNYHVWRDGLDLVTKVYSLTKYLPDREMYSLTRQIQRAAVSIPSNLAEGCSRSSEKEFRHFVEISLGSAFELETQLIVADTLYGLHNEPSYQETNNLLYKVQAELNALRNQLR